MKECSPTQLAARLYNRMVCVREVDSVIATQIYVVLKVLLYGIVRDINLGSFASVFK